MHLKGNQYTLEHIIHLIREIDYLKTQIQPHDTGHIYTTISTLQQRVETLMSETEKEDDEFFGSYLSDSDC